jgi:hypothetical protein
MYLQEAQEGVQTSTKWPIIFQDSCIQKLKYCLLGLLKLPGTKNFYELVNFE